MRLLTSNTVLIVSSILLAIVLVRLYTEEQTAKNPLELYTIPHHIRRQTKQQEEVRNGVPLVIYESWKTHEVPTGMRDNIHNLLRMNPEFDYYLYSDEDCAAFIEDNFDQDVVKAFHSLKPGAYKSDLWRYCILYKLGGVYMDIKWYTTVPLVSIIDEVPIVYTRDLEAFTVQIPNGDFSFSRCLYNGFIISPPKNVIFKKCIDDIVESCKRRDYKRNVLDITGPCLLGAVVEADYSDKFIDSIEVKYGAIVNLYPAITYKGKVILKQYDLYRSEQKRFNKRINEHHYGVLYGKRDVYQ